MDYRMYQHVLIFKFYFFPGCKCASQATKGSCNCGSDCKCGGDKKSACGCSE